MSKKSIEYLKSIEGTEDFYNAFIVSYIGILGLYQINTKNNLLKLQLKKYRQVLHAISDEAVDVYYMIDRLYKDKRIKTQFAIDLIMYFQKFRDTNFTLNLEEHNIKDTLKKLPNVVYRNLDAKLKFLYKGYIGNAFTITELVNKFYSYAARKKMTDLDFFQFAKKMKRKDQAPEIKTPPEENDDTDSRPE